MTEAEFRHTVLSLRDLMYGIALRMGIPADDAADVVQDTQIKLWRAREGIPPDAAELKRYCLAALKNESLTYLRRQREKIPIEEAPDIPAERSRDAEYDDTRNRIESLIDSLPTGQRDVIRMSSFGDLDNSEIATATGLTEANVRQLLSRGRRRLRELLKMN
jgi:RNA polymerase sigma-70 factor (ECF subfamily)